MDWSKTKNVLIVVFLLLNIFLAVNLVLSDQGGNAQKKNAINAVKILGERGVVLKCKIPEIKDSYRISYENIELDRNKLASLLIPDKKQISYDMQDGKELLVGSKSLLFHDSGAFTYKDNNPSGTLDLTDKDKLIKFCANFLYDLELPASEYYMDEYIQQDNGRAIIKFKEKQNEYIIFSNEFVVYATRKGIAQLECRLVKAGKNQSNRIKSIVPAYQILLRHYLQDKTTITSVDIGFECTYSEKGKSSSTYPVWRVRTQDGEERFFSTMDGAEQKM